MEKLDWKMEGMIGKYQALMFHNSKKLITLHGKVIQMHMQYQDRNVQLSQFYSFIKTGKKLIYQKKLKFKHKKEV